MENAKTWTSKSTSFTETNVSPYAENAGAQSQKKTSNGNNSAKLFADYKFCSCCGTKLVTVNRERLFLLRKRMSFYFGNGWYVKLLILNLDAHCARKGYQKFQEFKVVTRDGARKTIEMSLGIMKDEEEKPLGLVAISRDVPDCQKMDNKCARP